MEKSSEIERKRTLEKNEKIKKSDEPIKYKSKETPRVISSTTILTSKENQIPNNLQKSSSPNNYFYLKSGLKRQNSNHYNKGNPDCLNNTLISMKNTERLIRKTPQKSFHFDSRNDLNSYLHKESGPLDTSQNLNQSIYSTTHNQVQYSLNKSSLQSKQKFIGPTSPVMQTERMQEPKNTKNGGSYFESENEKKDLKNNSFSKFFEESNFKKSTYQKKLFQSKDKTSVNIKTINLVSKNDEIKQEKTKKLLILENSPVFSQTQRNSKVERRKNDKTFKKKSRFFDENKEIKKQIKSLKLRIKEIGKENKEIEEDNEFMIQSFENDVKSFNSIKKENLILKSLYEMNKIFNVKFELSTFECFRNYPEIVVPKSTFQIFQDKLLGRGGFAEVFAGIFNKKHVAIKIIKISNDFIRHLLNEIITMVICTHENLVKLHAISIEETKSNEITVYLIMELMNKDLKQIVFNEKQKLCKLKKYEILCDVLKGLAYLHDSNYVHCDLKMQNILLDQKNKAKISDFGLAKTLRTGNTKKSLIYGYSERCSSYEYLVEERISTKGDIWSFGILAYELLKEKISWEKLTGVQAVAKVSMKTPFFSLNEGLDDEFENQLIESCLNYNYAQRPTARELHDKIKNKIKTFK